MAKYVVDGIIRVQMTVEADSEDEALEMAEENFDFETHVKSDALPEWETANSPDESDDEDEEDDFRPRRSSRYIDDEDADEDN